MKITKFKRKEIDGLKEHMHCLKGTLKKLRKMMEKIKYSYYLRTNQQEPHKCPAKRNNFNYQNK